MEVLCNRRYLPGGGRQIVGRPHSWIIYFTLKMFASPIKCASPTINPWRRHCCGAQDTLMTCAHWSVSTVQRRWTKQIEGLEDSSCAERLKELDWYSVQGRFLRADLIEYWTIFHGKNTISPEDIFHQPPRRGMRGHCFKLFVSCAVCSVRQRSFSQRRVSIWNSLPEDVVTASDLSDFKRPTSTSSRGHMLYLWLCLDTNKHTVIFLQTSDEQELFLYGELRTHNSSWEATSISCYRCETTTLWSSMNI